jgi:RNA polymerase sigma-70 factor (ECF subfamily)
VSEPDQGFVAGLPAEPDDPDRAAIARLAGGDPEALEGLYGRYGTMAYSLAYRITGDGPAAEDAVQEAFLGVWRNAGRYEVGRGSVRTWILSIVHHRAIDSLRRRRTTSALPDADEAPPEALTMPDLWDDVAAGLDREAIRAAMASIPAAQRESIELAYFGGLTQVEIADRLAVPLGTVKSRQRLGLLALRRVLVDAAGPLAAELRPVASRTEGGAEPSRTARG